MHCLPLPCATSNAPEVPLRTSKGKKVGRHVFLHQMHCPHGLIAGFQEAVKRHEAKFFICTGSAQCRKTGTLKLHHANLVAFAKCTQRLVAIARTGVSDTAPAVPSNCAQCQLGFSDLEDWMAVGCPCWDRHIGTSQGLQHACTCGSMPLR